MATEATTTTDDEFPPTPCLEPGDAEWEAWEEEPIPFDTRIDAIDALAVARNPRTAEGGGKTEFALAIAQGEALKLVDTAGALLWTARMRGGRGSSSHILDVIVISHPEVKLGDGEEVAACSLRGHVVELRLVKDGSFVATFTGHRDWVNAVAFSPHTTPPSLISCSDDCQILCWDLRSGPSGAGSGGSNSDQIEFGPRTRMSGHERDVVALDTYAAEHADGRPSLASGSWDGTARLWDLDTGTCEHTIAVTAIKGGNKKTEDSTHVSAVAVFSSPSIGQTLAMHTGWGAVALFSCSSAEFIITLAGHEGYGRTLLSVPSGMGGEPLLCSGGSGSPAVRIWNAANELCVRSFVGPGEAFAQQLATFSDSSSGKITVACAFSGDGHDTNTGFEPIRLYHFNTQPATKSALKR